MSEQSENPETSLRPWWSEEYKKSNGSKKGCQGAAPWRSLSPSLSLSAVSLELSGPVRSCGVKSTRGFGVVSCADWTLARGRRSPFTGNQTTAASQRRKMNEDRDTCPTSSRCFYFVSLHPLDLFARRKRCCGYLQAGLDYSSVLPIRSMLREGDGQKTETERVLSW